jgi:hypothetical protein
MGSRAPAPRDDTLDRRHFLRTAAAGVMAFTAPAIVVREAAPAQGRARRFAIREDRFGRMFPGLRPFFDEVSPRLLDALRDIGKPGGMLDAHDDLGAGPVELITDPGLRINNPDNPTMTAGFTFMGQFMDHDMTFDLASRLGVPTDPALSANSRTPAFDLDSVYGAGPDGDPQFYVLQDRRGRGTARATKFKVEAGGSFEDLPRDRNGAAIISDPRNDENLIISGLQTAFLLFHNRAVDVVRANDRLASPIETFHRARQLTTWHYQWLIVHEVLPRFVGQELVDDIVKHGRRFYRPVRSQIPVEFQGAAYRFGHSLVRPSYRANMTGGADGGQLFLMTFDPTQEGKADPDDLRGGCRAPRRFVGWQTFFDFGAIPRPGGAPGTLGEDVRPNKRIDTRISTPLFDLPIGTIATGEPPTALPQRNLLRQVTWEMPSGQSIAGEMGVPSLATSDFQELREYALGLDASTPLWLYILKEAELMADGRHLGPVGGRIVGEVVLGLLQLDHQSYLHVPRWRPTLPTTAGRITGDFRMIDFLTFAGVDPSSRRQ